MLQLVKTDYVYRWHLYVDTEAAKYDAFRVELLEQSDLMIGDTVEALWRKVQTSLMDLRTKYEQRPLYQWLVFSPYARIIALDAARVSAEISLKTGMVVGECHPDHAERVRGLARALDALEFLRSPPSARSVN